MCEDWHVRKIWDCWGWDFVSLSTSGWRQSFDQNIWKRRCEAQWIQSLCPICGRSWQCSEWKISILLTAQCTRKRPFYSMWDDYTFRNISNCSMLVLFRDGWYLSDRSIIDRYGWKLRNLYCSDKWMKSDISRFDKVRLLVNQLISLIYPLIVARSLRHHLWKCLHRSGSVSRWQRRTMPLIFAYIRAATNDYFDNRLVGRLLFRLIGLNKIILFIDKIHTIPHSAQCPSNTRNAMKTYRA